MKKKIITLVFLSLMTTPPIASAGPLARGVAAVAKVVSNVIRKAKNRKALKQISKRENARAVKDVKGRKQSNRVGTVITKKRSVPVTNGKEFPRHLWRWQYKEGHGLYREYFTTKYVKAMPKSRGQLIYRHNGKVTIDKPVLKKGEPPFDVFIPETLRFKTPGHWVKMREHPANTGYPGHFFRTSDLNETIQKVSEYAKTDGEFKALIQKFYPDLLK